MHDRWQAEPWALSEKFWYRGKMSRRRFMSCGVSAAAALGALMAVPPPWREAFGQTKSYKVGTLQSLTGPAALIGQRSLAGLQVAVERINREGGVKGRPVELVVVDDQTQPAAAIENVKRLVGQERIDAHIGAVLGSVFFACLPLWEEFKVVNLAAGYFDTTGRPDCTRYTFKTSESLAMQAAVFAPQLVKNGGPRWRFVVADYSSSWEKLYTQEIVRHGGTVGPSIPFSRTDPFQISGGSEGILSLLGGADNVRFFTEAQRSGLSRRSRLAAATGVFDIVASGLSLDGGVLGVESYFPTPQKTLDTPYFRRFLADITKRLGEFDSRNSRLDRYVLGSFEAMSFLKAGILYSGFQQGGDSQKLLQTLAGLDVKLSDDFPQGDKTLRRDDHQAFMSLHIFEAKSGDFRVLDVVPRERLLSLVPPACRVG